MSEETARQEAVKILQELRDLEARAERCLLELGWQHKHMYGLPTWCKVNHPTHIACWPALSMERAATLDGHTYTVGYDEPERAGIYRDGERLFDLMPCECGGVDCRGWRDVDHEWAYIDPLIIEGLGLVRRNP